MGLGIHDWGNLSYRLGELRLGIGDTWIGYRGNLSYRLGEPSLGIGDTWIGYWGNLSYRLGERGTQARDGETLILGIGETQRNIYMRSCIGETRVRDWGFGETRVIDWGILGWGLGEHVYSLGLGDTCYGY